MTSPRPAACRSSILATGPVRAVLFDYGLTLVDFHRPADAIDAARTAIAQLIERAGHPAAALTEHVAAVHDRVDAAVAAHESTGALDEVDVAALERTAFADAGLDLDDELRDRCSRILQEAWFHGVRLFPEAREALRDLRAGGLRLGVCSNAPYRPASMHDQLAHAGLADLIDAAVFSAEVGWRKPSPHIFAAALSALGTTPHETVFVGDRSREDMDGASALGMRTVLLRRAAGPPPVGDGDPEPDAVGDGDSEPDAVVESLSELPALLLDVAVVTIVGTEN